MSEKREEEEKKKPSAQGDMNLGPLDYLRRGLYCCASTTTALVDPSLVSALSNCFEIFSEGGRLKYL